MKDFVSRSAAKSHPGYESMSPPAAPTIPSPASKRGGGIKDWLDRHFKILTAVIAASGTIGFFVQLGYTAHDKQESFATRVELTAIKAQLEDATKRETTMHEQLAVQERALADIQRSVDRIERSLEGANTTAAKRGKPTPFPLQDK